MIPQSQDRTFCIRSGLDRVSQRVKSMPFRVYAWCDSLPLECGRDGPKECLSVPYVQCLLTLLDSPLNKAGKLQVCLPSMICSSVTCMYCCLLSSSRQVFIHTRDNVLIEVNPYGRCNAQL